MTEKEDRRKKRWAEQDAIQKKSEELIGKILGDLGENDTGKTVGEIAGGIMANRDAMKSFEALSKLIDEHRDLTHENWRDEFAEDPEK